MASRGVSETNKLRTNIEDQLGRLLAQLQDLEDLKADIDDDEYPFSTRKFHTSHFSPPPSLISTLKDKNFEEDIYHSNYITVPSLLFSLLFLFRSCYHLPLISLYLCISLHLTRNITSIHLGINIPFNIRITHRSSAFMPPFF